MAILNFKNIAAGIATYMAANVTPPSGEALATCTSSLPDTIANDGTLLVFPPAVSLRYGASLRAGTAIFPVRLYLYAVRDTSRNSDLLLDWATALYAQLEQKVHLGLENSGVNDSKITGFVVGELEYATTKYHGIEFTVDITLGEALSPTA